MFTPLALHAAAKMHPVGCGKTMDVDREVPKASSEQSPRKRPLSSSDLTSRKRSARATVLKIVSATYGPSEGRRLLTGELSNDLAGCLPFTRDVAPFLKALLVTRKLQDEQVEEMDAEEGINITGDDGNVSDLVCITGRKRNMIPLMGGRKMNIIFGDPCPGTSKRLKIHYVTYESIDDGKTRASSASEVHRVSFAEHDHVVLRPRLTYYQDDSTLRSAVAAAAAASDRIERPKISDDSEDSQGEKTLRKARSLGRAQSIAEFAEAFSIIKLSTSRGSDLPPMPPRTWRLRSATSEIVLPILLPFLKVKERVQCKLVCVVWRHVIQDLGVAKKIDVNDDTTFPNFTLPILRGLLAHSHHSLQSLFLSDFRELTKEDLHIAIPYLRKLECLDISRCNHLDDSTLLLLSEHVSSSLEVFYLKGLKVTDRGMMAIAQSCGKLQVLEISNVPITDESGIGIGENLTQLRALYMRDNYLLTNRSIDVITEKCTKLSQLTLWGCTRLRHLSFHSSLDRTLGCGKLVILNLWGCHSLADESATALGTMKTLRSLIVSECHRLTNTFLVSFVPQVSPPSYNVLTKHLLSLDWLRLRLN